MNVWLTAPVTEEPEIVLRSWHVFETPGGGRHFCGYNAAGREGRVSSRIETFDPDAMAGRTRSGRIYRLEGEPGFNADALYVRANWCVLNGIAPDALALVEDPGAASPDPVGIPAAAAATPGEIIQEWHGYVLDMEGDAFTCRLLDVTAGDAHEDEEATIPLAQVPEADRHLVQPGAYFRWTLHATDARSDSRLDFTFVKPWTQEEIDRAAARGAELHAALEDLWEK